ncbi:abkD [Symbiodinium sp. KB8]|nr:abkD [Symbiodinium sp. KB8]
MTRLTQRSDGFLESMRGVVVGVPRFYYAVYNAGRVAADYKLLPRVADWQGVDEDSEEYSEREARVHQRAADRILSMSLSMGGLWVKLAQYVSTLKPMVPEQFTSTLAAAQDSATGRDYEEIAQVIEQELGARPEELFAYFEKKPVAAASIAQVHRAVTLDGERVAIKVQYPSLPRQMAADIAALRVITWLWGIFYPDYDMQWLLPEFEESLLSELDFRQEAITSERTHRMLTASDSVMRNRVHIPAIRWDLTSERVMAMEWIDGVKPTSLEKVTAMGLRPQEVAETACTVFADMIFLHGMVHTDPHPGNLLVRAAPADGARTRSLSHGLWPDSGPGVGRDADKPRPAADPALVGQRPSQAWQLVVLDHGMYRRLSPSFRQAYCALWEALMLRDEELGRRAAIQMGLEGQAYDALSLMLTYRTGTRGSKEKLQQTMKNLANSPKEKQQEMIREMPRDFFFVSRNLSLVRGLNLSLGGTTASRISISGDAAVRGMALNENVWGIRELFAVADAGAGRDVQLPSWWWDLHHRLGVASGSSFAAGRSTDPANPFCRLNEPTDSELLVWLRTAEGRARLEAAILEAELATPELAEKALAADVTRQNTPESNMQSLKGAGGRFFGTSAASAAGYACNGGKSSKRAAVVPSASLVALATAAAAEAKDRAASAGTLSEIMRSVRVWWAVTRARLTVRALDAGMWLWLAWGSLISGGGLTVEDNWGEFGGPGSSGRRRHSWTRSGKPPASEEPAGAEIQNQHGQSDEEAVWADTAPPDASPAERRAHAKAMRDLSDKQIG